MRAEDKIDVSNLRALYRDGSQAARLLQLEDYDDYRLREAAAFLEDYLVTLSGLLESRTKLADEQRRRENPWVVEWSQYDENDWRNIGRYPNQEAAEEAYFEENSLDHSIKYRVRNAATDTGR